MPPATSDCCGVGRGYIRWSELKSCGLSGIIDVGVGIPAGPVIVGEQMWITTSTDPKPKDPCSLPGANCPHRQGIMLRQFTGGRDRLLKWTALMLLIFSITIIGCSRETKEGSELNKGTVNKKEEASKDYSIKLLPESPSVADNIVAEVKIKGKATFNIEVQHHEKQRLRLVF